VTKSKRPFLALAVLGVVAMVALPGGAQQQVDPLDPILDSFETPTGREYVAQFLVNPTPGVSTVSDPVGDFEHSSGQAPGFTPQHIDIVDTWIVEFDPGPIDFFTPTDGNQLWARTGPFRVEPPNFDTFHTFTGDEVHDGTQYAEGALLFGFTLADTPPATVQGRCEFVVWVNDLDRDGTFINHPSFPGDPAGGTNVAYGLAIDPDNPRLTSSFKLGLSPDATGFLFDPVADVRAFVTPDFLGITVPKADIGDLSGVNFYSFCSNAGGSFEPEDSGADQTGLIALGADDLGLLAISEMIVTTSTLTETTTTIEAPQPTAAGPSQPEVDAEKERRSWWPLLLAGFAIGAFGWWILTRRRPDPCSDLHDALGVAEKALDVARAEETAATDACRSAETTLDTLERERTALCKEWPPACWATDDGDFVEDAHGNRITGWDVHMRKVALGDIWADYKAGNISATEIEAKWREMDTAELREEIRRLDQDLKSRLRELEANLEESRDAFETACARAEEAEAATKRRLEQAEAAKMAYEECIG
jgi:hypothetical protein